MENNLYDYQHEEVKKYFELHRKKDACHILSIKYSEVSIDILEEWLNNYTTLLNVWFCELIYNPITTDNAMWESNLLKKLKSGKRMTITEIIDNFKIFVIALRSNQLVGVSDLEQHLCKYMAIRSSFKGEDLLIETLTGQRTNLTLNIFSSLIRNNESQLNIYLRPLFPMDPYRIPLGDLGYHNLASAEKAREEDIKELIRVFDWGKARLILVQKGYVE